jgi:hypothetical protein
VRIVGCEEGVDVKEGGVVNFLELRALSSQKTNVNNTARNLNQLDFSLMYFYSHAGTKM